MIEQMKNDTTVDLEKLHAVQLQILDKLDEVCKNNGIRYFLAFGTLIGAVRNEGFIPWDDDIDVAMLYEDYQRLKEVSLTEWGEDFFLQEHSTDPEYTDVFMRLRMSSTTLIMKDSQDKDINHGVFINIYPLISLSDNSREREWQLRRAHFNLLLADNKPYENHGAIVGGISGALIRLIPKSVKEQLIHSNEKKMTAYENSGTEEVFAFAKSPSLCLSIKKECFREAVPHQFEHRDLLIPSGYHDWLTLRYGDYMTLPEESERTNKMDGYVVVDVEKPYTEYKGSMYCKGGDKKMQRSANKTEKIPSVQQFAEKTILLVLIIALWQVLSSMGFINPIAFPSPAKIVSTFVELVSSGKLWANIWISISRVLKGYFLAAAGAIILGVFIGLYPRFKNLTALLIQIVKPIPPIAWIPLVILWFGIGESSKVFLIFIGGFFTILTNVVDGIRQTDVKLIELSKVMETPRLTYIFKVVIPSAAPYIFTGLRVGLGQSWMCVVAAELVASATGVGYMIMNARQFGQTEVVIVGMLTIGIIGKVMDSLLTVIEKRVIKWA